MATILEKARAADIDTETKGLYDQLTNKLVELENLLISDTNTLNAQNAAAGNLPTDAFDDATASENWRNSLLTWIGQAQTTLAGLADVPQS